MIHYFTYYSFDEGYQTLYLGHENNHATKAYRLPYLEDEKAEALENGNVELAQKVKRQEALPMIYRVTYKDTFGWPNDKYISSGTFSLIYSHCGGEKFIIAKRGIPGCDKDIYGRTTPFLIAFLCDEISDLERMNCLAVWMANHPYETDNALSRFLHYDSKENGLCFEQTLLEKWLQEVTHYGNQLRLIDGSVKGIIAHINEVSLLVVPCGIAKKDALADLALGLKYTNVYLTNQVEPCDNKELAQKYKQESCSSRNNMWGIFGVTTAILLFGCIIYMCSRQ